MTERDSRLDGATVVASVSGGKDSTAMSLWLTEQGIEHRRVFMDTGWEDEGTYAFLRDVLPQHIGPIEWLRGPHTLESLVVERGMFPRGVPGFQFCSTVLKFDVVKGYLAGLDAPLNAVGIRAAESTRRAQMTEWEWSNDLDCWVWRPLIAWSVDDVIAIHTRHGCPPNPLYLRGASRVGCHPCINAGKGDLARLSGERVDVIRELEARVTDAARIRHEARGLPAEDFSERTFFRRKGAMRAEGTGGVGIDEVMAWARTGRGGRQLELIATPREPGCVRWGLCDTGNDDDD